MQTKGGDANNFVTEVDVRIEQLLRAILLNKYPDHKVIGEELGWDAIGRKDAVWIIDPIDGTTNFIHGIAYCCISIALWDNRGPLVGVIYNPTTSELLTAAKGRGALLRLVKKI